jgi:2-keto-3-deoxy-L-rhamnonate aldolase RhmA
MRLRADVLAVALVAGQMVQASAQTKHENLVLDLWTQGKTAFGVYAPNENPAPRVPGSPPPPALYTRDGGEKLAMHPLYDYVFLNLEGAYESGFVKAMAEGLRSPKAVSRKTLIVRIPPIDKHGAAVTKARVKEILDLGADGVTIPHIVSLDQAKQALSFFQDAKADVWSPSNPKGEKIAMLMIEDPGALAQVTEFADLKGLSILACGIGSLAQALGGDRAAAEKGTQTVLAETKRAKLVNMLPASPKDVEQRVKEGFLAVLAQGPTADETIRLGRAAVGR